MPFSCVFIPSSWVSSYPTAGWHRTHSLGRPLPIRWVRSHFLAGYNSTHSLGTKQTTNNRKNYSNVGSTLNPKLRAPMNTLT